MEYTLTFQEVLQKTLLEGNKGMFQGSEFKRGVFLKVSDFGDSLMLHEYKDKDDLFEHPLGNPVLSKGLISQKYREVFIRQDLFEY